MKINALIDGIRIAKNWSKALNYQVPEPGDGGEGDEAMDDVQTRLQGAKIFRNGQLLILRGGIVYTVTGQQIQ